MTHNMTIKAMANDFIVWRAASSVNWDCTIGDIAEETGLCTLTVSNVLRRKGWRHRVNDADNLGSYERLSVDDAMRGSTPQIMGRF